MPIEIEIALAKMAYRLHVSETIAEWLQMDSNDEAFQLIVSGFIKNK